MANKKTNEQFQKEFKEKGNENIEVLGKYIRQKEKIAVACKKCGRTWEMFPDSILRGAGCKVCLGIAKKNTEEFIADLKNVTPFLIVEGEYISTHEHIAIKCSVCNFQWNPTPANLLRGYGCPYCNGGAKLPEEVIRQKINLINPDVEMVGEYVSISEPILFSCKRCGNLWETAPNVVINGGSGCPACAHSQTSFWEQVLLEVCRSCFGVENVKSRVRNIIGKELDIVVLGADKKPLFAIEPGSWLLHKNSYEKDLKKIDLCKKQNIDLLVIYDQTVGNNIEENENIWCYEKSFGKVNDDEMMKLLVRLSERFSFDISGISYEAIKEKAYAQSRRISTEEFKRRLEIINPNIIVLGDYNGSDKPIKTKCAICEYEWNPKPQVILLQKCGCPRCKNRPHKDTEYFKNELIEKNPNVIVLGEYIDAKTNILVECKMCGNRWEAKPDKLRIGRGCRICGHKKVKKKLMKPVRNIDTGDEYESISEARNKTGIKNIGECCRLAKKDAGGHRWEFIKQEME